MKNLSILFSVFILSASSNAIANQIFSSENIETQLYSHRFQPCSSWRYSMEARGDVCSFKSSSIEVPDYYDYQRTIRTLESRIEKLEGRLLELEKN